MVSQITVDAASQSSSAGESGVITGTSEWPLLLTGMQTGKVRRDVAHRRPNIVYDFIKRLTNDRSVYVAVVIFVELFVNNLHDVLRVWRYLFDRE